MTTTGKAAIFNTAKMRHAEREGEALDTHWDAAAEAAGFLNLFRTGRGSLAVLEWDIRMTDAERDYLIEVYPENTVEIAQIQRWREHTWQLLLGMLTANDRAKEQDRLIDARSQEAIDRVPLEMLLDTKEIR